MLHCLLYILGVLRFRLFIYIMKLFIFCVCRFNKNQFCFVYCCCFVLHMCMHRSIYLYTFIYTGVYLLTLKIEVPHSTWSFFLRLLTLRRSWYIWNWPAWIFTTVGCHGVNPSPPFLEFSFPCSIDFTLLCRDYYPVMISELVSFSLFLVNASARTLLLDLFIWPSGNFSFQPVCQRVSNF